MHREGYPVALFAFLILVAIVSILGPLLSGPFAELLRRAGPALLLLAIHALVHLRGFRGWAIPYHAVQTVLLVLIGVAAGTPSPIVTLTAWMCGETIAAAPTRRVRILATGWHGLVGLVLILAFEGVTGAVPWIAAATPTVGFVIVVILLYVREARARESAQELARELADANRRIAGYARRAAERTREDERRRMARDLHDTLAQGLTGIILQIQAAEAHIDGGNTGSARTILAASIDQARSTLAESRRVIDDLREGYTAEGVGSDLEAGIRSLAEKLTQQHGRPVRFTSRIGDTEEAHLTEPILAELADIVREAVHNAVRHGECEEVHISLAHEAGHLLIETRDTGCGFHVDRVPKSGHYGIRGMRERAERIGGELSITSEPGSGTRVAVEIRMPSLPEEADAPHV